MGNPDHVAADAENNAGAKRKQGEDHLQRALDEALRESFPASDPIAVSIARPVVVRIPDKDKP